MKFTKGERENKTAELKEYIYTTTNLTFLQNLKYPSHKILTFSKTWTPQQSSITVPQLFASFHVIERIKILNKVIDWEQIESI